MLNILADSEAFPDAGKVLLDAFEQCDSCCGVVCAIGVPCEEAREVLDCPQRLIAADFGLTSGSYPLQRQCAIFVRTCRRNKAVVMANHRVVNEGVSDHLDLAQETYSWCWKRVVKVSNTISSNTDDVWMLIGILQVDT